MGLFGGDSSSSTSNFITTKNTGASGGAIAANESTVNVLDAGAVQGSLGFASHALDVSTAAASDAVKNSLGFAGSTAVNAFDFSSHVNDSAMATLGQTFAANLDTLQKGFATNAALTGDVLAKTTLDSGQAVQQTAQTFVYALAAVVVLFMFANRKRSA